MMFKKNKSVAFFGWADAKPEDRLYKDAYETAKLVAKEGFTIVNGGGPGIMKATTLGAKAGGGEVTGVTFYPKNVPHFEGRDKTNVVDKEIITANYVERTLTMLDKGDVYVIFNGGTGTISEFAMAWGLAKIYFGNHKPLILFGDFWYPIMEAFGEHMLLRPKELQVYQIANSPEMVVKILRKLNEK
ncbi:MAG: LOG family protein [bacterium]|nr:LOG family protein [bacterium]